MRILCALAVIGCAQANFKPTTLQVPEMNFKLNVLKNSESLTGCQQSPTDQYTVVSVLRSDKERAKILNPYVVKLMMQCQVQEVHTWDLYEKEDGHLAGEMADFDSSVPEMFKVYSDWRSRYIKSNFMNFYSKYAVPDRKNAVLLKLDDSVLYMDLAEMGRATSFAATHPENFLTLPNLVNGNTVNLHQKCLPDKTKRKSTWMKMSDDHKTAMTHRFFIMDPPCFALTEKKECVALDDERLDSDLRNSGAAFGTSGTPTSAYLMHWDNLEAAAGLLQLGDEGALFFQTARKSCMLSSATMAAISQANKQSEKLLLPTYKLLAKKIQAGSRITDDGISEEILSVTGLDEDLEMSVPKKHLELFEKQETTVEQPMCSRVRSYVDLGQCVAPQKTQQKWLQLKQTNPRECSLPCSAAPDKFQGAHFISEDRKLAFFSSPKLTKPLNELFQTKAQQLAEGEVPLSIEAVNPKTGIDSKDYKVVVSAHEPLQGFAHTFTNFMKAMQQIGVNKRSLKQTIAYCKSSPKDDGCQELLTKKVPVLEKWIELEAFDHSVSSFDLNITTSLIQSVFNDIQRLVYPGCEAQLGEGTTPQLAAFLPSYLTIQTQKPFHVLREEYAEEDLQDLWQKIGMRQDEAKAVSSLAEFGYSSEILGVKTAASEGAKEGGKELMKDIARQMSLLENNEGSQNQEASLKAMSDIAKDVHERVQFDSQVELIKKTIKGSSKLTRAFCSIYSMDYACLGYQQEFEQMCGALDGPEKVSMRQEFLERISTPKFALRKKMEAGMRAIEQKACLTKADSQISFLPFINTAKNCQAQCEAKAGCKTYNYDASTYGCTLYNSAPVGAIRDLHSTCGAVCKDNNEGVQNLAQQIGLSPELGDATCEAAAKYCSNEDIALNCAASCGLCAKDIEL